ncbi:uncharacterized protein LOC142902165 [Nelusetta ayraudi]|uniref:uncharacterized protein LOC142902165 n=1 Tax=Nelusetta ayraudi TaxID=303726 RepID=UPI003F6FD310
MKFPVDLLADVNQGELEQSARTYMTNLLFSDPYSPEQLTLSDSTQTPIDSARVSFAPLYGSSGKQKILALFSPSDPLTAVALHLLDRWWTVDDVLKTGDPSRDGVVEVKTIGERIVLYLLNRVIYRAKEMNSDELPFLCHGENDYAKILWKEGEAVGFYSVKAAGTLWNMASTRRYQIPVLDSVFVRKSQRGQGLGLKMLQDYVLSFKENSLGLRYPLPTSMYKVCKKYLCQYPGGADLLWEVESVGEPHQRTNLSSKIHSMDLSAVSKSLSFTEESLAITQIAETDVVMDASATQIKQDGVESTGEIVEEVTVSQTANETEPPVKPQGRSCGIRIEDIEAETPHEKQDLSQQMSQMPDVSDIVRTEDVFSLVSKINGEGVIDATAEAEATTTVATEDKYDVTAPVAEQPQTEDDTKQSLNAPHDSQIIVENVASEIEETNDDLKQSNAELGFSEETAEQPEETQTLSNVGEGIVLESTVTTTTTTYTRHYRKQCDKSDEVDEVTEEKGVSAAEVVEELDGNTAEEPKESAAVKGDVVSVEDSTEGNQQELENEPLTNEIQSDKQEESVLKESVSVLSDTTDDVGTEGTGVEQGEDKSEEKQGEEDVTPDLDDEQDVPPVVQRRSLRGRYIVVSKAVSTKRHKGEKADEPNVEIEKSVTNEKVVEQMKEHPVVDENIPIDKTEQDVTPEKINIEDCVPIAEEATENITTVTEVCTEECKVVLEHAKPETVSLLEDRADDVVQESLTVAADSGTVMDTVSPVAEELQGSKDTVCEVPKLHQATVILVDFKLAGPKFAENNAIETPAQGECPALDKDQAKLMTSEEEQTLRPDMMVVEELDDGKMVNSEEISGDVATEGETDDKECHHEDTADTEKSTEAEVPFVNTRVLRSGRKMAKANKVVQKYEEDDTGNFTAEEKCSAANTDNDMDKKEMEAMKMDSATSAVPVEEEEVCKQLEADSTVADVKGNLSPTETDEDTSQEQAQVSTRALRSKTKSTTASPAYTKTRSHVHKQGESDQEEPTTTITLRSKRRTSTDTPRRTRKQNQNKEVKVSTGVLGTEEKPEEVMEEAAQHVHLESEETIEQPDDRDDVVSEGEAADETMDLKKGEEKEVIEVDGPNATEEQPEARSETEAITPVEEGDEGNAVTTDEEIENTPVIVTRSLRSGTKTSSVSPSSRFRRQNKEKAEPPTESFEEQNIEVENEAGVELKSSSPAAVEGTQDLGTVIKEVENEAVDGVQLQAQADTAGSIPEGSLGEHVSESMLPPLSDPQSMNEVLVDLKSTSHDLQDEAADAEESAPETVLATDADKADKKEIVEDVDVPVPDSAASELDDQPCTSKITSELHQEEAVEEAGHVCVEKQEPVVLLEEQCTSIVDSVPGEDTEVLVQQDVDGLARVEETPVEDSGILRSDDDTVTTTDEGKPMQTDEDEGTAGEEGVKDELTVGTRKRRRSATTTPRRKSKRACRQSKKEEKEGSTSAEESQEEGPKAELEDIKEENEGEKTEDNDENKAEVLTEDGTVTKEDQEQGKEVSEDRNTIDEPTVETRVLRKRRSAAAATPRRTSKRVRSELKEAPEITKESSEPEDESTTTEAFTEESLIVPLREQEAQPVLLVTSDNEQKETSDGENSGKETASDEGKATDDEAPSSTETKEDKEEETQDMSTAEPDVVPDRACIEEESPVPDTSEVTEDHVPTRTSRSLRSKTRTSLAKPSHSPSNVEEQEGHQLNEDLVEPGKLDFQGQAEPKEAPLVELPAGDDTEDQAEETVDLAGESIADIAEDPEENLDSGEETSGSADEEEDEDEWSMSEEEAIIIGSRVLRGRTVPSLVITPNSTPRRHSTKVQVSEENRSPVDKSSKRKSAGLTPASSLKRRSKV